jgi:hypothetical protein
MTYRPADVAGALLRHLLASLLAIGLFQPAPASLELE